MGAHKLASWLEQSNLPADTNKMFYIPGASGYFLGYGTTVPSDGTANWSPGALFLDYDASAGQQWWVNEGTATSSAFKRQEAVPFDLDDDENIIFGTGDDFTLGFDGTQLEFLPATDDTGAVHFGDGTTDADVKVFLGASTKYVLFDVGNVLLTLEDVDLRLGDNDILQFGDGADVAIKWNASNLVVTPATDDTGAIHFGDGTTDMDVKFFLGDAADFVLFDVGEKHVQFDDVDLRLGDNDVLEFGDGPDVSFSFNASSLVMDPLGNFVRIHDGLSDRFELSWVAGQHGLPVLNADIALLYDQDFEILGTNATADDVTYNAEGGITFETDGADGDEVILLPHLDANQTPWTQVTWGTDQEVIWSCHIKTDASIGNCIIWAGLKLTNTEVTGTDADQAFFRYENGVNSGKWQAVSSIGGADDAHDSGVTVAINTAYHLVIAIASDRTAKFYINGALVETSAALTDATDLIPYIGVAADGAAEAKKLHVRGQKISRAFA